MEPTASLWLHICQERSQLSCLFFLSPIVHQDPCCCLAAELSHPPTANNISLLSQHLPVWLMWSSPRCTAWEPSAICRKLDLNSEFVREVRQDRRKVLCVVVGTANLKNSCTLKSSKEKEAEEKVAGGKAGVGKNEVFLNLHPYPVGLLTISSCLEMVVTRNPMSLVCMYKAP